MKDIDDISRYIDPLINKYIVVAFIMRDNDVRQRPFTYNFGTLLKYLNPRHVRHSNRLPKHTTVPTVPNSLVLYHTPIHFSLSRSSIYSVPSPSSLSRINIPPKAIRYYPLTQLLVHLALS